MFSRRDLVSNTLVSYAPTNLKHSKMLYFIERAVTRDSGTCVPTALKNNFCALNVYKFTLSIIKDTVTWDFRPLVFKLTTFPGPFRGNKNDLKGLSHEK